MGSRLICFVTAAAAMLTAAAVSAQDINEAVTFEDLGFTRRLHTGARAAGLAGAYSAIGQDAQSLVFNPAGLAGVQRIELSIGFQHDRNRINSTFFGSGSEVDVTSSDLDYIVGAYPFPTYRGSLVMAAGVHRVYSSHLDLLNRGVNVLSTPTTIDTFRLQQSGSIYSYNLGIGVDLSPTISGGVNFFLMDGTIKALTQFSFHFLGPFGPGDFRALYVVDDAEVDLDGYGATIGAQYHPHPLLNFGLSVTTPVNINIEGDAFEEDIEDYESVPDSLLSLAFLIDVDYRIPFRIDGGVSFTSENLLLSADVSYSDWTQTTVNKLKLKDQDLRSIFRDVWEFRVGAELTIPGVPVRLRGGYARLPYALKQLQADRIEGTLITPASVPTERHLFAGGIGGIVGDVLTLDATFEYWTGERAISTLNEERTLKRVLLSGSYRF
jgi:long-subunit fatty acid transport protein